MTCVKERRMSWVTAASAIGYLQRAGTGSDTDLDSGVSGDPLRLALLRRRQALRGEIDPQLSADLRECLEPPLKPLSFLRLLIYEGASCHLRYPAEQALRSSIQAFEDIILVRRTLARHSTPAGVPHPGNLGFALTDLKATAMAYVAITLARTGQFERAECVRKKATNLTSSARRASGSTTTSSIEQYEKEQQSWPPIF